MEPVPERNPNFICPPFTKDQVENLNLYQIAGFFHPFTCGKDVHFGKPGRTMLIATEQGWSCPDKSCEYKQEWAHPAMADRSQIEQGYRLANGRELSSDIEMLKNMLEEYISSFEA